MLPSIEGISEQYQKIREEIFNKFSQYPLPTERYTELKKIPFSDYLKIEKMPVIKEHITTKNLATPFPEFLNKKEIIELLREIFKLKKDRILSTHLVFPTGGLYFEIKNERDILEIELPVPEEKFCFQTYIFSFENSEFEIYITQKGEKDLLAHHLFVFILKPNSQIKIYNTITSKISYLFNTSFGFIDKDSHLEIYSAYFNNPFTKNDKYIYLRGEGANVSLRDVYLTNKDMFLSLKTNLYLEKDYSKAENFSKGVLKDNSRVSFYGLARVEENVKKVNAFVEGDALLLSDKAQFYPVPSLEILANDLRCTHAVNTGPLSEEKIFYLTSRGIEKEEAIKMYVEAYLLSNIEGASEKFKESVREKLNILYKDK